MAYGVYLVVAPSEDALQALAHRIAEEIGTAAGDPLVAVGALRALLVPQVAERLAAAAERPLDALLAEWGASRIEPLAPERLAALLAYREPGELTLERGLPPEALAAGRLDWHIACVRLQRAWQALGGPAHIDWDGVQVGQIDTGFTEHPCLGWRDGVSAVVNTRDDRNFFRRELAAEPGAHFAVNKDPYSAADPLSGPNGGHGTRTASVLAGFDLGAAARTLPGGEPVQGYYGAAPKVPHVPIRLSDCVMIDDMTLELGDALEHLLEQARCQVITLSMGAAPIFALPRRTRDMIDLAYRRGVIVCCAAGNYVPFVVAPARGPRTIAVAGSAPGDRPWLGSSFGRHVDVAAPAWPIRRGTPEAGGAFAYGYGEGTSYATPQVAGAAALWLVRHRDALAGRYPEPWMRVAAFRALLRATARRPAGWDNARYGEGILDAGALLSAPLPAAAALVPDREPHYVPPAYAEPQYG